MSDSADHLMSVYPRLPVTMVRGQGVWMYDSDGQDYLDAISGIGVTSLGHGHPEVTHAIQTQAATLIHSSNCVEVALQQQLAEILTTQSGLDKAFFCNSGAEANEAAIKLCRLYGHQKKISEPQIIVMDNAFHGRTMATLSASGSRKVQAGFEPLMKGFIRAPFNDLQALENIANNNANVVALMVEPIQGNAGVILPDAGYLQQLRALCDQHDWLLVLDEVQTGLARTGAMFAFQHEGILPDVLTLAKALGNGVPVAACLVNHKADCFQTGNHGSTNGGNCLSMRVGVAVMNTLIADQLAERASQMGELLLASLRTRCQPWLDSGEISDIRGKGLMLAIEFAKPCLNLSKPALSARLLITICKEKTVRLLPPLIISEAEIEQLVSRFVSMLEQRQSS